MRFKADVCQHLWIYKSHLVVPQFLAFKLLKEIS